MQSILRFAKNLPLLAYYLLVFLISWGGVLLAVGPQGFAGINISYDTQLVVVGSIIGFGPLIAGLLMIGLLYGRAGFRDLRARLGKWRVHWAWYAVALLTGPLLSLLVLRVLGLRPAIATDPNPLSLLLMSIGLGMIVPIGEEPGWTGFATPEWRKRFGVLATGVLMGLLWGLWHLPMFTVSARESTEIPSIVFLLILLFTWLVPFRVLMVWVYDHTHSLLLAMLMHLPIVVDQIVLSAPQMTKTQIANSNLLLALGLWIMVALVWATGGFETKIRKGRKLQPAG